MLVPINAQKSQRVREVADRLYETFNAAGIETLYDDRDARPIIDHAATFIDFIEMRADHDRFIGFAFFLDDDV